MSAAYPAFIIYRPNLKEMTNDICCIGHITHDRVITPAKSVEMAGGTAFYFAWAISRLTPAPTFSLVTKVGSESLPEVERMRRAGIDVTCHRCAQSVFFENKYGHDPNDRTQRVLALAEPFAPSEVSQLQARVFHLGTLLADDFPIETVEALAERGRVSIDVQGYLRRIEGQRIVPTEWHDKARVLGMTHVLKVNEMEMQVVTGLTDPRQAARMIASYGVSEVLVTLGSYGSLIYADGTYYDIPAYRPRQVTDATGCGDTYTAAYLYGRTQGMGYAEAGRMAAAMCTLKLEHSGPFDGCMEDIYSIIHNANRLV